MALSSNPLESGVKPAERKSVRRPPNLELVGAKASERGDLGHVLRCGQVRLWSVPLEYLFFPKPEPFTHVVTVHAEIFSLAHRDPKLGEILNGTISTIDGRVLQGICQLLYPHHKIVRQNGSNFSTNLAEHCRRHSEKLFLLGSSEQANSIATQRLRSAFPGLQVSGFSPPLQDYPFPRDWNALILDQIASFKPHHLVVCFGPKKQEYWIHENSPDLTALGVRCAYGLGGTIDFLSGAKPRAPKWIEFIGAEWLFRLACEPRRRFWRTLTMFKMPYYALRTVREIKPVNGHSVE